jgi:hypothetical protein
MTLIELGVILWPLCALVLGLVFGFRQGLNDGLFAGSMCLAVPYVLFKGLAWVERQWRPDWPPCRKGVCNLFEQGDYAPRVDPRASGEFVYVCRCGDSYKRLPSRPTGSERFVQLEEDGRHIPYLFHRPWRKWEPEPAGQGDSTP